VNAAEQLRREIDMDVGVVNARFARPVDETLLLKAIDETGFVITVEESTLCGGFGSACLEAVSRAGIGSHRVRCLGIPDRFIEHGSRDELLADLGLDAAGLVAAARETVERTVLTEG